MLRASFRPVRLRTARRRKCLRSCRAVDCRCVAAPSLPIMSAAAVERLGADASMGAAGAVIGEASVTTGGGLGGRVCASCSLIVHER